MVVIFTIPYVLWTSAKSIARVLVRPISKESEISIGPLDAPAIAKLIMGLLGVALVAFGLIEISRAVMRLAIYWNDYPHMISDFAPGFVEFIVGLALLFKSDWWPKRATTARREPGAMLDRSPQDQGDRVDVEGLGEEIVGSGAHGVDR